MGSSDVRRLGISPTITIVLGIAKRTLTYFGNSCFSITQTICGLVGAPCRFEQDPFARSDQVKAIDADIDQVGWRNQVDRS